MANLLPPAGLSPAALSPVSLAHIDNDLTTPLHYAAQNRVGHEQVKQIVVALLGTGANPNVRDEDNNAPLHYAAENDLVDVVEALLNAGAHIDAMGREQRTPLHMALNKNAIRAAEMLIRHGAMFMPGTARTSGLCIVRFAEIEVSL